MNLTDYGFLPNMIFEEKNGIPARVTAVHKERYDVVCENGETHAKLKASVYFNDCREEYPTTGDFVTLEYNPSGDSLITSTLPRKTFFSRRDPSPGRGEQAVAANFDYVFIMQSLNHDFNAKRLERYLTLSWQSGALPVVILTKADLTDDCLDQIRAAEKIAIGAGVFAVSAKTGYGLEALSEYLKPRKTIVFLGSSGVGKSSLVNVLAREDIMAVNDIREDDSKGRHTTTHRQLIKLDSGVMIIDTPGMRELGMWDVTEGLGQSFADVEQYLGKCKFSDCKHQSEPGCAVREAIASGELQASRWESYLNLKTESRYSDDKAEYLRQKELWHKGVTKQIKDMKKSGDIHK